MEKVSVIVPVYNGEKCIKRCADSILSQDYGLLFLCLFDASVVAVLKTILSLMPSETEQ